MRVRPIVVGTIKGAYGIRGWVKVESHTDPAENILRYSPWTIAGVGQEREYPVLEGRVHRGNLIVARLLGIEDRDQAGELGGSEIAVSRAQFEPLRDGQYYWTDLLGLEVRNLAGIVFGTIVGMMETGANDVMEVKQEDGQARLIPFVLGLYVKEVRLDDGLVIVDWDPDF